VLELVCRCRTADEWDQSAAKRWWQIHLPELMSPARSGMDTDRQTVRFGAH